ncbi:MAG: hypothetical protein AMXMBFR64_55050 [Myxococcales bacterium]
MPWVLASLLLAPAAWAQGHAAAETVLGDLPRPAPPPSAVRYNVRLTDLDTATVTVCVDGAAERLVPGVPGAQALVARPVRLTSLYHLPLAVDDRGIDVSTVEPGECVRFVTSLAVAGSTERPLVRRVGADVVLDPAIWLWRPEVLPEGASVTLHLALPPGVGASVPWPFVVGQSGPYRLGPSALRRPSRLALGALEQHVVKVTGGELDVAILDGRRRATDQGVRRWLLEAAHASTLVYGTLPADRVQVLVEPVVDTSGWPVPFAEVLRGGGVGLHLRVAATATDEQLAGDDHMALHSLAHLLLPRLGPDAAWLEEGIATYYQVVLRARAGARPPEDAIARLDHGFRHARVQEAGISAVATRGKAGAEPVGDAAWHRWAGTAFALAADVRLRSMNTGDSLDGALASLRTCCMGDVTYTARQLVTLLDEATHTTVFSTLYEDAANTHGVPSLDRLYEILGMGVQDGRVATTNLAPYAYVRLSIFSAR